MKFILYTANMPEGTNRTVYGRKLWGLFPDIRKEECIEDTTEPYQWCVKIVAQFNRTCRPGEPKRVFLGCEVIDSTISKNHLWEKSCLVTQKGGYDTMKCKRCGITGKCYGLGQYGTIRDQKYSKEKYRNCKG